MSLLRDVLAKTDKFLDTAGRGDCFDCGGMDYRDALRGMVRVLELPRKQRWYVVHAYDRLERYRKYLRRARLCCEVRPAPAEQGVHARRVRGTNQSPTTNLQKELYNMNIEIDIKTLHALAGWAAKCMDCEDHIINVPKSVQAAVHEAEKNPIYSDYLESTV